MNIATSEASRAALQTYKQRTGAQGLENLTKLDFSTLLTDQMREDVKTAGTTPGDFITDHEFLARIYFDHGTFVSSNSTDTQNPPARCSLTTDDFAFLKRATGYNYVIFPTEDGYASTWLDDEGNFPSNMTDEQFNQCQKLVDMIDIDRETGALTGPITQSYINELINRLKSGELSLDPSLQDRMIALLAYDIRK